MRKYFATLLAALFALPLFVYAVNITVPSAPGANYYLSSTSTGQYLTSKSITQANDPTIFNVFHGVTEFDIPLFGANGVTLNASTTAGTTFSLTPAQFCFLNTVTIPAANTTTVTVIFPSDAATSAVCGSLTIGEWGTAVFDNESNFPFILGTTTGSSLTFRTAGNPPFAAQAYPVEIPANSSAFGIPEQTSNNTAQFMLFTTQNFGSTYASTTALSTVSLFVTGQAAGCAQFDANAKLTSTGVNCGSGGGGGSGGQWSVLAGAIYNSTTTDQVLIDETSTTTAAKLEVNGLSAFKSGYLSLASSTVGAGTKASGLTIAGGSTTTLNAYFATGISVGTSSPEAPVTFAQTGGLTSPEFVIDGVGAGAGAEMELNRTNNSGVEANIDFNTAGAERWQLGMQNNNTDDFELWQGTTDNPVFTINQSSLDVNIGTTTCGNTIELCVWGDTSANDSIFAAMTAASTSAFIVNNNGNVGINGTSSPYAKLAINSISTGDETPTIVVDGAATANGNADIAFNRANSGTAESNIDFNTAGVTNWQLGTQNVATNGNDFILSTGANASVLTVKANTNVVGVGTSTPFWELTVATGTAPQIALSDGNPASNEWTLRTVNGIFYLATSTAVATSSTSAFTILNNGRTGLSTSSPGTQLSINNVANFAAPTSTLYTGINITQGCFSVNGTCVTGGAAATGANPTASVGLSVVNGSASTFLRSDAAPALDQTISPTMTGVWAFNNAASTTFAGGLYASAIAARYFIASSTIPSQLAQASTTAVSASAALSWFSSANDTTSNPAAAFCTGANASCYALGFQSGRGMIGFDGTGGYMILNGGASKGIQFKVGGTSNTFNSGTTVLSMVSGTGNGGLGSMVMGTTSSYGGMFTIASSTGSQLVLSDSSTANPTWNLRSISGNFFLATSTAIATSTVPAMSIVNGTTTFSDPTGFTIADPFGSPIVTAYTASTTYGANLFELWSASSTGPIFAVDMMGHVSASSTAPVLSSCGTTPSLSADSSDFTGTITVGSVAATACTLSFGVPHTVNTHCFISEQTGSVVNASSYTEGLTGFTYSQTGLTSDKLDYICTGR